MIKHPAHPSRTQAIMCPCHPEFILSETKEKITKNSAVPFFSALILFFTVQMLHAL